MVNGYTETSARLRAASGKVVHERQRERLGHAAREWCVIQIWN